MDDILIIGGGVGGLATALALHRAGLPCRVFEAVPEIRPIGVGINLLPHATQALAALGLEEALARVAVATREAVFYNRFGQLIYREPLGRDAGYGSPQFSIHRADLHGVLLHAFRTRVGPERLHLGWKCAGFEQDEGAVTVRFVDTATGVPRPAQHAPVAIAADGIHSAVRKQRFPDEGPPKYSGVNMWRGAVMWPRFLTGASMVRAGWLANGKMVIYPIRDDADGTGRQLVNWVAEIETEKYETRDWNRPGRLEDFIHAFEDWHFDWLDVPAMIRATERVLEFPMVDQDPLPHWTAGRVTLLGDAAHPMYPRGSNGAGQAILDAQCIAARLAEARDPREALQAYEAERLPATAKVVLTNRTNPPDAINREVWLRTGDRPFANIDDVISAQELRAMSDSYKRVAGYDRERLAGKR
jgi:2-polyprenyl-6-methoxyphenol hydroxylase-like FAD-dependent oxidoreductase